MSTWYIKASLDATKEVSRPDIDFLINALCIENAILDGTDYLKNVLGIENFLITHVQKQERVSEE